MLAPKPVPKPELTPEFCPPRFRFRFRLDPNPPMLGPGFMAMAISLLCSASFKVEVFRPRIVSIRRPGCGLSQLRGVEYSPSRGGMSDGGAESILESCSARFMDENPSSSSDRALSKALSSRYCSGLNTAGGAWAEAEPKVCLGLIGLVSCHVSHGSIWGWIPSGHQDESLTVAPREPFLLTWDPASRWLRHLRHWEVILRCQIGSSSQPSQTGSFLC